MCDDMNTSKCPDFVLVSFGNSSTKWFQFASDPLVARDNAARIIHPTANLIQEIIHGHAPICYLTD